MPLITGSSQTLAANTDGAWWTPTAPLISVDCDTNAVIAVYTRRGSSDTVPKLVYTHSLQEPSFKGPCSAMLQVVVGRDYRIRCVSGSATVAAQEP